MCLLKKGDRTQYEMQYPMDLLHLMVKEGWIAWKDGQDHSIMPRRKSTKAASVGKNTTEANDALHVYNENPNENLIGDCAVRAVAGVLEISWKEAVRKLAAAQDYSATVAQKLTELSIGTKIQHKVYGTGEVIELTDVIATIRFQDNVEKKLATTWILANCKPG